MFIKKRFFLSDITLTLSSTNSFKSLHTLWSKYHVGKLWARFEQRKRKYAPNKDFSYNSGMTFKFDLEN